MKLGLIVRRYAGALFSIAQEKGQVEDIGREVEFLGELFSDPALSAFLRNPQVGKAEKKKIFLDKVGPHVSAVTRNFVALLFDRNREDLLEGVARAYRSIAQESLKVVEGQLESAQAVSDEQRSELELALSKKLGWKVKLTSQINPELIGGIRITVGHKRFEMSVAAGLSELRKRWLRAPLKQDK